MVCGVSPVRTSGRNDGCLVRRLTSVQHCCAGIGWVVVHVIGRSVAHSYWLLSLSGGIVALECVLILD